MKLKKLVPALPSLWVNNVMDNCNTDFNNVNDPWGLKCDPLFNLSDNGDSSILESMITEPLEIAAAPANVFKLLGIHEQGVLVDLLGNGRPISSSSQTGTTSKNVFDETCGSWMSAERGKNVLDTFIGYDFGPIRQKSGVPKYDSQSNASVYVEVGTIVITQSHIATRRVSQVRVERSMDGSKWYGVGLIDLIDSSDPCTVHLPQSAPARYWRLRPLKFNGQSNNDVWEVNSIRMMDYKSTKLDNLQDELGFMESRDRDYSKESIGIKMYYDLFDARTELSKVGIDMSSENIFAQVSFRSCVSKLGRPLVIGDIVELPPEAQYTTKLEKVKKYLEVIDVYWSTEGYTPNWKPVLQRVIMRPAFATQETMDIFDIDIDGDKYGFIDTPTDKKFTDYTNIHDTTMTAAKTNVPQKGTDVSGVTFIHDEDVREYGGTTTKLNYNNKAVYIADALPPNGQDYTEGDSYPESPKDGQYHRLTYKNLNDNIPPRLYKYSVMKEGWIYCETDRRQNYSRFTPSEQRMVENKNDKM